MNTSKSNLVQFTSVKNNQSTRKSPKNRTYKRQNQRPTKQAMKKRNSMS